MNHSSSSYDMISEKSSSSAVAAAAVLLTQRNIALQPASDNPCAVGSDTLLSQSPTPPTANTGISDSQAEGAGLGGFSGHLLLHDTATTNAICSSPARQHGSRTAPSGFHDLRMAEALSPSLYPQSVGSRQSSHQRSPIPGSPATPSLLAPIDLRRQLCDQNVFVFHLPIEWTDDDLRREFAKFGSILSFKIVKRPDGSSKGYGFVCYSESQSAFASVEAMNGKTYGNKRLKVSLKKTPEECLHLQIQKLIDMSTTNRPFDCNRDCTLFVFHLPSNWNDQDMYRQFQSFGTLTSAKIATKADSASRGYGFITYSEPRAAALAIANMNGVEVGQHKRLKVQLKQQSCPLQPPTGGTIFIFHIPNDWTENQLRKNFGHFGKILWATVQRDSTGSSRGFGFMSFANQRSALNAIAGMNGFSVGHKRLKVLLKRSSHERYTPPITAVKSATREPRYRTPFVYSGEVNPWDDAEYEISQSSKVANHNQLPISMQQTFAPIRQSYIASGMMNSSNDVALRVPSLVHQTQSGTLNYPSITTVGFSRRISGFKVVHQLRQGNVGVTLNNMALASTSAPCASYLPHWNTPTDLGLRR